MATILVVDDEPAIRALIRAALAKHTVLEAADGLAALEVARARLPQLVLLDVALPALSGLEVCRRLKADPATARTTILLLTGLAQSNGAAGADGCIAKPFSPAAVVQQVEQALQRQAAPAGP